MAKWEGDRRICELAFPAPGVRRRMGGTRV
jgi:hypothetical protein